MRSLISVFVVMFTLLAFGVVNPKSSLKKAESLIGDYSQISTARQLVNAALADSLLSRDAKTHYVAGKIENCIYEHGYKQLSINRNNPNIDKVAMSEALISAYRHFMYTMEYDTIRDKKGQIKPKYTKDVLQWLDNVYPYFYTAGIELMNKKKYFPAAFDAFTIYGELPSQRIASTTIKQTTDSMRANSFFYAGVMAYYAEQYEKALDSFEKARERGFKKKELFINEITSIQKLSSAGVISTDSATRRITTLSREAHNLYHLTDPVFIQKFVAGNILLSQPDSAISEIELALNKYPESIILHQLKGDLMIAIKNYKQAETEYKICADSKEANIDMLRAAAKLLVYNGVEQLKDMAKLTTKKAKQYKKNIIDTYFTPATQYIERALKLQSIDNELRELQELINYYSV